MVIAVGMRNSMMSARLIILQLVGMILAKCRIKVLFLIWSMAKVSDVRGQCMEMTYSLLINFWITVSSFSLCQSVRRYLRISRSIVARFNGTQSAIAGRGPVQ